MKKDGIHYFLGTNSPFGFEGYFDNLSGENFCYILKGGPGTGKSTLMNGIAGEMEKRGEEVQFVHCSSDPDSLDAVVMKNKKICIADGTAPHIIEPVYPGVTECIVNLGEGWNGRKLRENSEAIIRTANENKAAHSACVRLLKGAEVMIADSRRIQKSYIDEDKLNVYAQRLANRLLKKKKNHAAGKEHKLFLSAVTPKGIVFFGDTVKALAKEIIVIDDSIGEVSSVITDEIRRKALNMGYDVISAFCPMSPHGSPEHIIIPECSLAFVRSHCACRPDGSRTIHAKRFIDSDGLKKHRQRLAFNRKVRDELILQSVAVLKNAKKIHDELEGYYAPNMDFERVKKIRDRILGEIE